MKTTFDRRRGAAARAANMTCSMTSPALRCLVKPACPVAQNVQPMAHPAWDETHTVTRSS